VSPESDAATTPLPALLEIVGLHASVEGQPILQGIDLTVGSGRVHAIMARTIGQVDLANVLLGNPAYEVTAGSILFHGEDITRGHRRRASRIFLAFQDPESIGACRSSNSCARPCPRAGAWTCPSSSAPHDDGVDGQLA